MDVYEVGAHHVEVTYYQSKHENADEICTWTEDDESEEQAEGNYEDLRSHTVDTDTCMLAVE